MNHDQLIGKKVGVVSVHIYKETTTNSPFFYIKSENDDVLPVSHIIEDALKMY